MLYEVITNIAVIVVPILAPRVYGKICSNVNKPAPDIGTISEVVIELLCTIIVKIIPTVNALSDVLNKYWSNQSFALETTIIFNDETIYFSAIIV